MQANKRRPYTGDIEEGIKPVCEVLNDIPGVSTLWSCEGHPERPTPPFVMFFCSHQIAARLDQCIQSARRSGQLKFCWWVRGNFDDTGLWRYSIESNDYRVKRPLMFGVFKNWQTDVMRTELSRLADIITTEFS